MKTLRFVTIAAMLTSCGSSIDLAAKAAVDARIAGLKVSSTTIEAPPSGVLGPMPLAAGQWAQYEVRLSNGQRMLVTEKILEQQGDSFLYEIVDDTYQGRTIEQLLVAFGHDVEHPQVELLALRKKDAKGRVVQVSARQLSLPLVTYNSYRSRAASLVRPWQQLPQETVAVPAGEFAGCSHGRKEISNGLRKEWLVEWWYHPAVPLSGRVRVQDSRGSFNQLVAFGVRGARSDFQDDLRLDGNEERGGVRP